MTNSVWCSAFIAFIMLWGTPASSKSLDELESIISGTTDLSEFLSRPELQKQYKEALQVYFGQSKFSCESFEEIIADLKVLNQSVPGFGSRLWKSRPADRFEVEKFLSPNSRGSKRLATYQVRSLPRQFHGIWMDPS